jgi:tetratricopeptide (TPR) repeat protein
VGQGETHGTKGEISMTIRYPDNERSAVNISHHADYFYRMAREAAHSGDIPQALRYIDDALAIDPDFAAVWHEKGNCLDELGRCEEAVSNYDKALQLDPHNAETWFNKGMVLKRMGREHEASTCMNHGIDLALGR